MPELTLSASKQNTVNNSNSSFELRLQSSEQFLFLIFIVSVSVKCLQILLAKQIIVLYILMSKTMPSNPKTKMFSEGEKLL